MWESVGLTSAEGAAYEALLHSRQADAQSVGDRLQLSRGQAARLLGRLVDAGLATRLPGRSARFAPAPPETLTAALIEERQRELQRLRAHAEKLAEQCKRRTHSQQHPAELVEVVEGAANVRSTFVRLQRSARVQIRGFDRPPYLDNPVGGNQEENRQQEDRGIIYRVVYDRTGVEIPDRMADIWKSIQRGERARVSNHVPMKMVLCDDTLALIPVATEGYIADAAYLVHPSSLLDAVSELFEAIWDRAVPLNRPGDEHSPNGSLPPEDADLIGLLAAGATDESIARTQGWSVRTVHRHVHRLMTLVGAQTRFQVGLEAGRRGWV